MSTEALILTILGQDKPGIIAKVTGALFRLGCNLEDVSMTILEDELAMILIVRPKSVKKLDQLQSEIQKFCRKEKLTAFWKPVKRKMARGEKHDRGAESYVISVLGKDRTGIVHQVSQILFQNGINITDLNSRILGESAEALYAMTLEADIKKDKLPVIQKALSRLQSKLEIDIRINPVERIEM